MGKFVKKAIVHYRDDLDLQNLMDYIQKEVVWPIPLRVAVLVSVAIHITRVFKLITDSGLLTKSEH